jgi:hypothetical protein
MQQVQKVNDYCTGRENCPKSRRRVGQHVSAMITLFARVAYNIFSTSEHKNEKKTTINNSSVLCVLCEKCNKHSLFARS